MIENSTAEEKQMLRQKITTLMAKIKIMFVINGKVWRVQMVRSDYPLLRQPNGRFAVGVCDYNYKIICISNRLKRKRF